MIRGIRNGMDCFSLFTDMEFRRNEIERLEDRFANEDHFARFDSFFDVFGNRYFDNLTRQVSREVTFSLVEGRRRAVDRLAELRDGSTGSFAMGDPFGPNLGGFR